MWFFGNRKRKEEESEEIQCQADLAMMQHREEEAEALYRKALEINPKNVVALNNLGCLLGGNNLHNAAKECFAKAVALKSDYCEAWRGLAVSEKNLMHYEKALEICDMLEKKYNFNMADVRKDVIHRRDNKIKPPSGNPYDPTTAFAKQNNTKGKLRGSAKSPSEFFASCTQDFHEVVSLQGVNAKKIISIPELLPLGEKAILSYLQSPMLTIISGGDTDRYYFFACSLALMTGINYAEKWHEDYDALKSSYANEVIDKAGHLTQAHSILENLLGLTEAERNFLQVNISECWKQMLEPYWDLPGEGPKPYVFNALLAAYQTGVSIVLLKHGY